MVLLFFRHTILFCELVFHRFFLSASQIVTVPLVLQWPHPWPHFKDSPEKAQTWYTKDCIISRPCSHVREELQNYSGKGGPTQPPALADGTVLALLLNGSGPTVTVPWKFNALGPSTTMGLCLLPSPLIFRQISRFLIYKGLPFFPVLNYENVFSNTNFNILISFLHV